MRKILLALFGLGLVLCSAVGVHKYYVSHTTVNYDANSLSYQVTMTLFTDDLETAMGDPDHVRVHLGEEDEEAHIDDKIATYLRKQFEVKVNDVPVNFSFLGKEVEYDRTHCYLEGVFSDPANVIKVTNEVFMDIFPAQKNTVNLTVNGNMNTLVLTENHTSEIVSY